MPHNVSCETSNSPGCRYATGAVSFIELNLESAVNDPIFYGQNKGSLSREPDKDPSKNAK